MPRFVLLRHECPAGYEKPSHWDLMLEEAGVLLTWELRTLPDSWAAALGLERGTGKDTVSATRLLDHRLDYLHFEGPISQNRGTVTRVAAGTFHAEERGPRLLLCRLSSPTICGRFQLSQATEVEWLLTVNDE